jgi:Zn-dependent protease
LETFYIIPILLFSVIIHEIAHGWVALKCGDPTAKMFGRLTLNPIPHLDLFGSIILPILFTISHSSFFIAWAKPVPVNPANFRNYRRDDILVSAAGPASNLLLALACTIISIILASIDTGTGPFITFIKKMVFNGITLNVVLAVFNLIPIPPLDGSHIVAAFLPSNLAERFQKIGFVGIFLIVFIIQVPVVRSIFRSVIEFFLIPFELLLRIFLS